MLPLIEDLLTEADRSGFVARAIRLGRRQMHLYEQWCSQYDLGSAPGRRSGTSEYNELPIETVAQDDYRGLVDADGEELALPCGEESAEQKRKREIAARIKEANFQIHDSDGRGVLPIHDPSRSKKRKETGSH
jgi:hypothetical protein